MAKLEVRPAAALFLCLSLALCLSIAAKARAADTCYYIPGVQNIDCSRPAPAASSQNPSSASQPQSSHQLRDELKRRLGSAQVGNSAQMSQAGDRLENAGNRIQSALSRAGQTRDQQEQARLRQEYEAARNDYRGAMRDLIAADPANKAYWEDQWRQQEAIATQQATQAGLFASPAPVQPAVAPAADPTQFVQCGEPDSRGMQSCYEVPPLGVSCRKTLRQGGNTVWSEDQINCDRADMLQQRNTLFAKYPQVIAAPRPFTMSAVDTDREIRRLTNPNPAAFAALDPACRNEFNQFLEDTDKSDKGAAFRAYSSLRADCDRAMRGLATTVQARLPERRLSSRASGALSAAMNADPANLIDAPGAGDGEGGYDMDEVMNFGLTMLDLFAGAAGAYAAVHHGGGGFTSGGGGGRRINTTYGQGSPTNTAPQTYHYGDGLHEGTAR